MRLQQKNKKLRRDEFLLYRGQYFLARERVIKRTPEEEFDLIYNTFDWHWKSVLKIEVARRKVMSGRVRAGGEPFAIRGRFIRESDSIRQFGNTRKRARAKGSSGT